MQAIILCAMLIEFTVQLREVPMTRIAVIQMPPVLLDREATIERAKTLVTEAADSGAGLVVFPETFIAGYPSWIWRLRPGTDAMLGQELHARLWYSAVDIGRGDLSGLQQAARAHGIVIVCGMNEKSRSPSLGTLYNTVVIIDEQGDLLHRHRKLMPTNPERMVWGLGDASGLGTVTTSAGVIGCLICWENYMPLARYALYERGLEMLVVPTYDSGCAWLESMGHIAREGRCWVVSAGTALHASDMPEDMPGRDELFADSGDWINAGDSAVFAPDGSCAAGPMHEQHGVLYADTDIEQVYTARKAFDVCGHYARPDIFSLHLADPPQRPG